MFNKFLFWVLTRVYRVNPDFVNPVNWRVAHPAESISVVLQCRPLIFQGWKGKPQYGFENVIFMVYNQVYLAPVMLPEKYSLPSDVEVFNRHKAVPSDVDASVNAYNRYRITYSLLKSYMELDPHIVIKKFPTRLLRLILKRNIPVIKSMIITKKQDDIISNSMSVSEAIQHDLSQPSFNHNAVIPNISSDMQND